VKAQNSRAKSPQVRRPGPDVVLGAVLAGGASRRMGADKALVSVEGEPMAARVAAALSVAGASTVVLVGAGQEAVRAIGLENLPDSDPGSGPLGGLVTALAWAAERSGATSPILLVAACDQPALDARTLRSLVDALAGQDGATDVEAACFVTSDGRRHPLPSAWRPDRAAGPVRQLYTGGERRLGAAFDAVATVQLPTGGVDLIDLDTPEELAWWRGQHHRPADRRQHP
jgi:molybdopterin-guanine dinucleotide biosynthesis protein A